jgi:flagellar basal body-associated protein FliL
MAKKGKEQDDEAQEEQQEELTEAQRLTKLEKSKKLSQILIISLSALSIVQLAGLITLFILSGSKAPSGAEAVNVDAINAMQRQLTNIETTYNESKAYHLEVQALQTRFDEVMIETDLNNFATIRTLLQNQEKSYQRFLKALKQGMYDMSRMVKGSRTWYEVYSEEIDAILAGGVRRIQQLEGLKPAVKPANN